MTVIWERPDPAKVTVPTGRKILKFTCDFCDYVVMCDKRKRDRKLPKFLKHVKSHKK